jgi:hypothetical protein
MNSGACSDIWKKQITRASFDAHYWIALYTLLRMTAQHLAVQDLGSIHRVHDELWKIYP